MYGNKFKRGNKLTGILKNALIDIKKAIL